METDTAAAPPHDHEELHEKPSRRVLLKLSGEVFGGGRVGVDPEVVKSIAEEIASVVREGRVNGFFKENVLLEQAFGKDPKKSVQKILDEAGVTVKRFARFRVGA